MLQLKLCVLFVFIFSLSSLATTFPENEINEDYLQEDIEKEKPTSKKAGSNEDHSNAHNFINGESAVNPRTGTFSFSIPIGYLNTHTRRFELRLMYSQSAALVATDIFKLGLGWYLNIPFIRRTGGPHTAGTVLQMGDGSSYTIDHHGSGAGELPLRYYDTDDICIETSAGSDYLVTQNGDQYFISEKDGLLMNLTTREGFHLTFDKHSNPGSPFLISNETDVIFNMTSNRHGYGNVLQFYTSFGTVKYETEKLEGIYLNKIYCHSCSGPGLMYEITYEPYPSSLINQIDHPSGLQEVMKYIRIGGPYPGKASAVFKMTRYPGSNKQVAKYKQPGAKIQVTTYDYNPKGDNHDFLGTPIVPFRQFKDSLLEYKGKYNYSTSMKVGNTCAERTYDKMHLLVKTTVKNCNTSKVVKQTLYKYSCPSDLTYAEMKNQCPNGVKHYTFSTRITEEYHSKDGIYREITENEYNNYADLVSMKKPNGQRQKNLLQKANGKGKYRGPLSITDIPSGGSPYANRITQYHYEPIQCYNSNSSTYDVVDSKTESYIVDGWLKQIRQVNLTYYTTKNYDKFYEYGRIKTETYISHKDLMKKLKHTYKYTSKFGVLKTAVVFSHSYYPKTHLQSSSSTDIATGLVVEEIKRDGTIVRYKYNLESQLLDEILYSNDNEKKLIKIKSIFYYTEYNNNFQQIKYSGGVGPTETLVFDNAGNLLLSEILNKTRHTSEILINTYSYDEKWRKMADRKHGGPGDTYKVLSTKYRYDILDRPIETTTPDGVTEMNKYHSSTSGLLKTTYQKSANGTTYYTPSCEVKRNGNTIRRGLLLHHSYNAINPCNYRDSLWCEVSTFDGFDRLETTIKFTHLKKSSTSLEEIRYHNNGFLHSKKIKCTGRTILNSYYKYDTMFNAPIGIKVKDNEGILRELATSTLDGFGRRVIVNYAGTETHNNYNTKDQLISTYYGKKEDNVILTMEYDIFGRKNESTGFSGSDQNAKKHVELKYFDDGKIKDVIMAFGTHKENVKRTHTKSYNYDKSIGKLNEFEVTTTMDTPPIFIMNIHREYELYGRINHETDFFGYLIDYKFNDKGQFIYALFHKKKEKYVFNMFYNFFGQIESYSLFDMKKKYGYLTRLFYDRYERIVEIEFSNIVDSEMKETKRIGSIHYGYDDFGRIVEKKSQGETPSNDIVQKFDYDEIGRLKFYECIQLRKHGFWKCSDFTEDDDGKGLNAENSYLKRKHFFYDTYVKCPSAHYVIDMKRK